MTTTTTRNPSRRTAALTALAALTIAAVPIGGCSITGKAGHHLAVASGRAPSTTLYVISPGSGRSDPKRRRNTRGFPPRHHWGSSRRHLVCE